MTKLPIRKHPWITKTIKAGEKILSVFASDEDLINEKKKKKFFDTLLKIGSDPRVTKLEKSEHATHGIVYMFYIND